MKIKWSPCAGIPAQIFTYVDENTINIDNEDYSFQIDALEFPDIFTQTNGIIQEAHRDPVSNELYMRIIRYYVGGTPLWDNLQYNDFIPPPLPVEEPPIVNNG